MKTWWWCFTWCFIRYQGSSIVPKWTSSIGFWLQELFVSLIASSAGVFFERPRICSRNFLKRGGDGASQREQGGGGKREEIFFLPSPSPFPSFALAPTVRVTISTLPNLPLSWNQRWRLQQCFEHKQGFAQPKYACTAAGYEFESLLVSCLYGPPNLNKK